jgi:alpha-L-fucosidase
MINALPFFRKTTSATIFTLFAGLLFFTSCKKEVPPPEPVGPVPSERQLAWHEMEFYAFVHFSLNTFTDKEWGYGNESPKLFNPTQLDCRQWARIFKDAGMKGIIITAKHHDGFCLWPSRYTDHSVKNSPWKDGKGDVIRELSNACKEYGLKFGIYLSPWDRNNASYGTPEYITYYRNQLRELLTNYGEVFEVWFDGANGGTGWYGGADENRHVDRKTYYDWPNTIKIVRELQPMAVIFSDAGPDIRWVGNEAGWAPKTNWCLLRRDEFYPGSPNYKQLPKGHENGTHWVPAEVDVSIRPGWFYHPSEDHKVKSLKQLLDIYYHSVGRNASFLLNVPPDRRGLIHEEDVRQLKRLAAQLKKDFADDLTRHKGVAVTAGNIRGKSEKYGPQNTIDENKDTYWATDDSVKVSSVIIDFGKPLTFNRFLVQEYIRLGQRVKGFTLDYQDGNTWKNIAQETTIGHKRILRFPSVTARKVRFTVTDSKACPVISNISIYKAPKLMDPPVITRDKQGLVRIKALDEGLEIHYTLDGSMPGKSSDKYSGPIPLTGPAMVKAVVIDPESGTMSAIATADYDIPKNMWSIATVRPGDKKKTEAIIDDNPKTVWTNKEEGKNNLPAEIIIDLGKTYRIMGFTYLPPQGKYIDGTVTKYELYISKNRLKWGAPVSKGEFSNIKNNPVLQVKTFKPVEGSFIKFKAISTIDDKPYMSIAELGILTK